MIESIYQYNPYNSSLCSFSFPEMNTPTWMNFSVKNYKFYKFQEKKECDEKVELSGNSIRSIRYDTIHRQQKCLSWSNAEEYNMLFTDFL